MKWLGWRAIPVLALAMVLIGLMAFAADQLAQAYFPHNDLGFDRHGSRGLSLVTRAMLMFAAAVLLGGAIGRLLPALLIGIAVAVGISSGTDALLRSWAQPTELSQRESVFSGAFPLTYRLEFRAPDGSPMSDAEYETYIQALYEDAAGGEPDPSLLPQEVFHGVAASRYPEVLIPESAAIGGAAVLAGVLAAAVVQRRRPE